MLFALGVVSFLAPLVSRLIYKLFKLVYRQSKLFKKKPFSNFLARRCGNFDEYDPESSDYSSSDSSDHSISSTEELVLQNEAISILDSHPLQLPLTRTRLAKSGGLKDSGTQTSNDEVQTYAKNTTEAVNIELKSLKEGIVHKNNLDKRDFSPRVSC